MIRRFAWLGLLAGVFLAPGCAPLNRAIAESHVNRAQTLLARDDLEAALRQFQLAAQIDSHSAVAHSGMGGIYRRMGDYDRAIGAFLEAIRRDPFSFGDTFNLAQLYHFTKRIKDAIQAYLHAIDLRPEDFDARLNLGVCYQQSGAFSQAADQFAKAIQINPDRSQAYVNLGVSLDAQGKHYEAIRAYKESLERDNRQPEVLVNLAASYMKQDRLKMARLALEEAARLDAGCAAAHEALGYCLFRLKEFDAARSSYDRALAADPRRPRAHAGIGSIYMLRFLEHGDQIALRDRALEHWHRSLELDPDQPRIEKLIAKYRPDAPGPEDALLREAAVPRPHRAAAERTRFLRPPARNRLQ
jgi:tetratricopeptide (TPR) repeat protein